MPSGEFRRTLYIGPLARRAEDLVPVLRIIAGPDGDDPYTARLALGDPTTVAMRRAAGAGVDATRRRVPLRPVLKQAVEQAAAALDDAGADGRGGRR